MLNMGKCWRNICHHQEPFDSLTDDLQDFFDDEGHKDGFTKLRDENMEQEIGEVLVGQMDFGFPILQRVSSSRLAVVTTPPNWTPPESPILKKFLFPLS